MPILHDSQPDEDFNLAKNKPILDIRDLKYNYPDGHKALNGITFQLQAGQKTALVGPNGSGKSTLMLNIIGIFNGEGERMVGGIPITEKNLPLIRTKVGIVFQNPDDQLFSPTVFEDVAFGPLHMGCSEEETRQRVEEALAMVNMSDYIDRLSYHLSMGEKKRVAIATVLSMKPDLIILDEPSAGLDPRARRSLINLLAELPQTLLVATHDLLLVREILPRMIVLDQGDLVADDKTEVILKDTALLEAHGLELPI